MMKIVIVEDNEIIRKELCGFLNRYGYETAALSSFEDPVEDILKESPQLVLLDINLPVYDGYYICRELRKHSQVPVIIVTSRDSEMDELMSMNLGADDFVTKPYNTQILLARISSVLKRSYQQDAPAEELPDGELVLHISSGMVEYRGTEAELSKNEQRILYHLMKNKGKIISRDELMEALWQSNEFVDDNTLTVNVNRLRKKLEGIGMKDYIQTRRGQGYLV